MSADSAINSSSASLPSLFMIFSATVNPGVPRDSDSSKKPLDTLLVKAVQARGEGSSR